MHDNDVLQDIGATFKACGHLDYGENISMQEHMLQTAWTAEQDGADDKTVVAALLHDYGHLVCNMPNNTFEKGDDNYHEDVGANAVTDWFHEDVVGAIRLHVAAKRYLCAANPAYFDKLSDASRVTLAIQGGPMNEGEMRDFEVTPGHKMAIQVRVYDDRGKEPEMTRPELDHYFPKILRCLKQRA